MIRLSPVLSVTLQLSASTSTNLSALASVQSLGRPLRFCTPFLEAPRMTPPAFDFRKITTPETTSGRSLPKEPGPNHNSSLCLPCTETALRCQVVFAYLVCFTKHFMRG